MKRCPFCAEEIQDAAIVCKHCGRELATGTSQPRTVIVQQAAPPSNGVAAVLSLFIPGAGQMYKGHVLSGLVWLVAVVIGYVMLIIPGLVLHLLCILMAASGNSASAAPAPATPAAPSLDISPERKAAIDASASHRGQVLAEMLHPQIAAEVHARTGTAPKAQWKHFVFIAILIGGAIAGAAYVQGGFTR